MPFLTSLTCGTMWLPPCGVSQCVATNLVKWSAIIPFTFWMSLGKNLKNYIKTIYSPTSKLSSFNRENWLTMCLKQKANWWHQQLICMLWEDMWRILLESPIISPDIEFVPFEDLFLVSSRFLLAFQEDHLTL